MSDIEESNSEGNSEEPRPEATNEKEVFVGPCTEPWWKFKLAGFVWWLVRNGPLSRFIIHLPGAERAGKWAFSVRVLSRDFEVSE